MGSSSLSIGIFREIIFSMLDAIKRFFRIQELQETNNGKPVASERNPARSRIPKFSREELQGISQRVKINRQEAISLPIPPEDLKEVLKDIPEYLEYQDQVKKGPLPFEKQITSNKICAIVQKMTQVSPAVAKQMYLSPEQLTALGAKCKEGIGALGSRNCRLDLAKLINFYVRAFNMDNELSAFHEAIKAAKRISTVDNEAKVA
jgi:hypothetical protein